MKALEFNFEVQHARLTNKVRSCVAKRCHDLNRLLDEPGTGRGKGK